jgi:hypothetical protein
MVESIVLVNKSLGTSLPINMATRDYVLENVDWGAIESSNKSYKFINQVGVYVTGTTLESRTISILGWVVADTIEDMKRRKKFLNSFVNPLQRIDLQYNEYRIEGIPETSIKYGSEMPENNEVMCKFLINLFCPDPMFYTQNGSYVSVANWAPKFKFPLIIPSGNYVTYGDTPQGGTLENPVELTGVSQFTVKNQLYQPKLVRPLHRVGDVRDVWQSKLKSVWDKKIIFDGSADEEWLQLGTNLPNKYRYALPLPLGVRADTSNNNAGSNNFPLLAQGQTGDGARGFTIAPYSGEISIIVYSDGGTLESFRSYLAANPMSVWYQSTNYDGTNGLDVCLMKYQTGFVELDGTEGVNLGNIDASADVQQFNIYGVLSSPNNSENAICSHFERANVSGGVNSGFQIYNTLLVFGMPRDILLEYGFITGDSGTYIHAFKAYLAAQKAAGTPVQVAYQLATAEVYADDPLKIGGHGIIMGLRSPSAIATITNTGTLPCGFIITFQASGTVENPKIIDINTQEYIRLSHTMQAGEVIRISTLDNNKTVRQIIGEDSINAFNFLDFANSTFLQLAVGINYLRYDADSGLDNLSVEFKFDPRYLEVQE